MHNKLTSFRGIPTCSYGELLWSLTQSDFFRYWVRDSHRGRSGGVWGCTSELFLRGVWRCVAYWVYYYNTNETKAATVLDADDSDED